MLIACNIVIQPVELWYMETENEHKINLWISLTRQNTMLKFYMYTGLYIYEQ